MTPEESFLAAFFGPENEIPWDSSQAVSGSDSKKVRPWVDRYLAGTRPAPLPRVRTVDGKYQTAWYIITDDRDASALVRAEIQGFLGPSYTDWDPLVSRFDSTDGIDRLVVERHPHALKATITASEAGRSYRTRADRVRERLGLWLDVRERQPAGICAEAELLADLVYRFEDALRLERLDIAEDHLQRIGSNGGLSSRNLAGLEFLLLEAQSAWGDIWKDEDFDRLVEIGPPRRVSQAMLRAAYNAELVGCQEAADAPSALRIYTSKVSPRCSPLLGTAKGLTAADAITLRLLRELARSQPAWPRVVSAKEAALEAGMDAEWVEALLDAAGVVGEEDGAPDADVFARVGKEFGLNDLDAAWVLAWEATFSSERSVWLLRLAEEAESLTWAHEALESLTNLGPSSRDDMLLRLGDRVRQRFVPELGSEGEAGVPGDWMEWARRLGESDRFSEGVTLAAEGRTEWAIEEVGRPDWQEFAEALSGVTEANEPVLRRSVPHLLSALGDSPRHNEGLQDVYDRLLSVVLLDPAPGETYFLSVADLLNRRLSVGMDPDGYADLLEDISALGGQWVAPATIPDLLDLADLLFFQICPDQQARLGFLTQVLSNSLGHLDRLAPPILALLSELAGETGWEDDPFGDRLNDLRSADVSGEVSVADVLEGKTLALYSLDESVLRRAKAAVHLLNPGVTVALHSEKVATDSLLAAARNADLFIVAHRSAKHAATDAIQAARVGPLKFALGKGSSSLVRAVWDWAEANPSTE